MATLATTDPVVAGTVPGALWRRGVARLLDYLSMLMWLFAMQVIGVTAWLIDSEQAAFLGVAVLFALLEIVYLAKRGQTPGKELLKIRVIRHGRSGPLGWGGAVLRWSIPGLALALPWQVIPLALVVLGLPALVDPQRRTIYDRIVGTTVVPYDAKIVEGPIRSRKNLVRDVMDRNIAAVTGRPEVMSDDEVADRNNAGTDPAKTADT